MFFAWNVVRTCGQIDGGLPPAIKSRMLFNVILDFGLGLVPFLGDLADAVFRANTRNAWVCVLNTIRQCANPVLTYPGCLDSRGISDKEIRSRAKGASKPCGWSRWRGQHR